MLELAVFAKGPLVTARARIVSRTSRGFFLPRAGRYHQADIVHSTEAYLLGGLTLSKLLKRSQEPMSFGGLS